MKDLWESTKSRFKLYEGKLGYTMKITLDHNCIIHLVDRTETGTIIQKVVSDESHQCFVVNIGASEMRKRGVLPDHYEKFEELLDSAGIAHLPRLNPMMILDVTFLGTCVLADNEMIKLSAEIDAALFAGVPNVNMALMRMDSPTGRKWRNRLCDVHSMWCHVKYGNDIFLTTDGNFMKKAKLPKLLALGAGRICHPTEFQEIPS